MAVRTKEQGDAFLDVTVCGNDELYRKMHQTIRKMAREHKKQTGQRLGFILERVQPIEKK